MDRLDPVTCAVRTARAMVFAMWVAPEARGRRAAQALCDACARWAADRGYDTLDIAVLPGNTPAPRAYKGAGFIPDRTERAQLILTRRL